jgi:hypothetical protein
MRKITDFAHINQTKTKMKLEPIDKEGAALLMPQDEKARRRSNTAPRGKPGITADELAQGVTLEQLQALPVPVLAYQTQITIHGQFPPVSPLCAGYKLLTRNANGSLGVRYAGIDAGKKKLIQRAMRLASSTWAALLDSRGLTLQKHVASLQEGREAIAGIPSGIYGSAGIWQCVMSGRLYVVVNVGAIRADDLWDVFGYFAASMTAETLQRKEAEIEAERLEREAKAKAERLERAAKSQEILETLRAKLVTEGAETLPETFIPGKGDVFRVLFMRFDGRPALVTYTLAKRGALLCIVKDGEKGRKVQEHHLSAWKKAAKEGRIFAPVAIPA